MRDHWNVWRCPVKHSKVAEREPSDLGMHLQNGLPVDHMAPVAPKANASIADNGCKCADEGIHNDVETEFFMNLAGKRKFGRFTDFDLAAWKLPLFARRAAG